ncbi:hypothetical protein BP6252_02100 [Coleophoma cylindrospora]|uniref:EXS-domain-containing protein n=1 Tax=Coleophoma cylindrospora TaxID=1849047 RepID=A0A3D8SDV2_9HELO|nr:hypothetical protein BP6252_02100 [Coleophoma cylindrospora]
MKFAKTLEQDLVPEWRAKYLDYKQGKKKVKAVARATNRAEATPRTTAPKDTSIYGSTTLAGPRLSPSHRQNQTRGELSTLLRTPDGAPEGPDPRTDSDESAEDNSKQPTKTTPLSIPKKPAAAEESQIQYGSFIPTPPNKRAHPFELPDPALPAAGSVRRMSGGADPSDQPAKSAPDARLQPERTASLSLPGKAYEVGQTNPGRHKSINAFSSLRNNAHRNTPSRPFIQRMFSMGSPMVNKPDVDMAVMDQVRMRDKEFFLFMDKELEKVESFYKEKEDEAGERLRVLREQLHEMRNRRIEELAHAQRDKMARDRAEFALLDNATKKADNHMNAWLDPLERLIEGAKAKTMGPRPGANSRALQNMVRNGDQNPDDGRDYVRRPHAHDVPYRTAKRKLKMALQEFYRSMELLKSYAMLNRVAFRKINKKYDKAVNAHPPLRYMSEKVNKAWFVQSDVLDNYMHTVEDLYARYFERGNHKLATGKLRSSGNRSGDRSGSAFKNGLLVGTGAVFMIQGIVYGAELLYHTDPTIRLQTNYLLQIYAGYFFGLYLLAWFCLDCCLWSRNKVNYAFVFEFDPRHTLDWQQLAEFPSFFVLLLGLFVWLNFSRYGAPEMFIYYPVILIFVSVVIILFPAPVLFYRARKWFLYSHWRLFLAGLYPVEFRDFFLGDMYCSLTYSLANIELFFCLYATYWSDPAECNSQHSRLLGFFTTLPSIWRGLQCVRRYYDTRNVFPHLVNCGKYSMAIMYYATLSMYRIRRSHGNLALFCTFAAINAIYSSIWDLLMDWSLLQPHAKKRYLRDVRAFKPTWYYYGAMILDPILRCNWIFYAIYTHDLQHSSIVSFLVGFSEVTRRGMWTLFRVENEHCANVTRFKASRDIPLPYHLDSSVEDVDQQEQPAALPAQSPEVSRLRSRTSSGLEAQDSPSGASLRRRATNVSISRIIANAHTQDFEKKRKPGAGVTNTGSNQNDLDTDDDKYGSSDDDDDEPDAQDIKDVGELIRKRTREHRNLDTEDDDDDGDDEPDAQDVADATELNRRHREGSGKSKGV